MIPLPEQVIAPDMPSPWWIEDLIAFSAGAADDVEMALKLADSFGHWLPKPGAGHTSLRWRALSLVASVDLVLGRIFEAHTDALAILDEAGVEESQGTWGVFAAEASSSRLEAKHGNGEWTLTGTKPWCSLANRLDNALVTAHVPEGRRLFAVSLQDESVQTDTTSAWVARGMRNLPSGSVHFFNTPARAVGDVEWYLQRPGFYWGGIGVAACWLGGAVQLARKLQAKAVKSAQPNSVLAFQLGAVDAALYAAEAALRDAADQIDRGTALGAAGQILAFRVRSVVAAAAERTLQLVGHALGPEPLAFDEEYARRTADLGLYLRQHHGERDLAELGMALIHAARQ